ncbi:MAG TPA: alpha/beta hydrolase [Symbiobacteriaceae bacterium]|nr:alpha/beta hydrolase [Symbiobacteriaceae bacterium]
MLFLHESGGSAMTWHGQLVGLAQSARCLVLDLPGHGRSEGHGFRSVSGYRQALAAFLDALAIRWPVVVAGVCLGAAVATDLALFAPERVAGLVLAGISEGGRACDRVWRQSGGGDAPDEFVHGLFSHKASAHVVSQRLQAWRTASPAVRYGDLTAVREYPLRRALRAVRHPMLLVAGEEDPIAGPAAVRDLAAGVARGRVATVPGAGCLCMLEQPSAFNRLAGEFLAGLGEAGPGLPHVGRPGGYRRA